MIIVIDGPSGSGKSSTAKAVSEELGIQYLDSGALYRAVTWIWLEEGRPEETFLDILSSKKILFGEQENRFSVCVDSVEVTDLLREPIVSDHVSEIAAKPSIREFVNRLMRREVEARNFIADGRDLGTAVFPDADLKFFMNASLDVRAERRYAELISSDGAEVTFQEVKENLKRRDKADSSRELDPLKQAHDAYVIDTTEINFDEQVKEICSVIHSKLILNNNN